MCDNIKVAVRVRPLVDSEKERGCVTCVESATQHNQISVNNDRFFTFNHVFGDESTQEEVYETAVQRLVKKLFDGYNVTVLAYGQTGSGKTHTMGSSHHYANGDSGVIPRAIRDIFSHTEQHNDWEFKIYVSFMELYKEQLYDLLATERTIVDIREDTKGICIPSLTEVSVDSPEHTMRCLLTGSQGRVTGATAMNSQSSRSHAIFTITIHQQKTGDPNTATQAKFHLVDLAGSERSKKTQAEGDRFREGVTINSGLLALGNVIAALGEGGKQMPSYRNSKLTRLLQDSLGGNSMTLMIACISPADYNMLETVNTLRYADRARRIKNKPIVNQDPKSAEIVALKMKVAQLQLQLAGQGVVFQDVAVSSDKDKEIKELETKLRVLRQSVNETLIENAAMRERMLMAESARDKLKVRVDDLQTEMLAKFNNFDGLTLPNDVKNHLESMKLNFTEKFTNLVDEQKRCEEEQRRHESLNELPNETFVNQDETTDDLRQLDEHQEKHTIKQCELNRELRQVEKELLLKVERCEQYAKTNTIASSAYKNSIALTVELEKQISELEKQKSELESLIKQLQAANKETDVQAKRSELIKKNAEIEVFKRKLAEQAKIVKQKEVAEKKVEQLNKEILSMKQLKVKLIKQMKAEGDQFKIWRASREREAVQLREAARKHNNEMARMQMMHDKQQNVSKRKLEQAVAANKRLKEALVKQNLVRAQRGMRGNKEQVQEFVAHEVEVLVSTVDARRSLQMLLEDREILTAELANLRRHTIDEAMRERLNLLEQEVELRHAQIADLQNKLADSDDDLKMKTRWDVVGSMADAKIALSHAVRLAADFRSDALNREANQREIEHGSQSEREQLKEDLLRTEQALVALKRELDNQRNAHHVEIINLEKERQETFGTLLSDNDKENKPVKDQLRKTEMELQALRSKVLLIAASPVKTSVIRRKRASVNFELEDLNISSDGRVCVDDEVADPTWRQTPLGKRLARLRSPSGSKRSTFGEPLVKCTCASSCATARCMCFKVKKPCGDDCGCSALKCKFKLNTTNNSMRSLESSDLNATYKVDDENDSSLIKRRKVSRD